MKKSVIFLGASSYVLPIIEFLHKNYNLTLVITTESNTTDAVPAYCIAHNIPYITLKSFKDALWQNNWKLKIGNWKILVGILADFRLLVPQEVIDLFDKGIVNIHPSLLPQYRGPTPGTTALLDGKTSTGVSLMLLDTKLDHGPLLGQVVEHILPSDTSTTLYTRLFEKGVRLLEEKLPLYLENKLQLTEQDHSKATYTEFLTRDSGYIDMNNSLEIENWKLKIERAVRAYFPWPGVWTRVKLGGKERIVKFLPDQKIQVEGKNAVSYKDFLNGYPDAKEWLGKIGIL